MMDPGMRPVRSLAFCVALGVFLLGARASAQGATPSEADRLTRRELLVQATAAQAAGRYPEALALAQRAEQIEATAGTRLLTAQLNAQLGRHVEALSSADLCLREVDQDTQTTARNRRRIREDCEAVRAGAAARVGGLTVRVPPGAPDALRVSVNGEELRAPLYGVTRPVNAGTVAVRAEAPGAPPWERRLEVAAGRSEAVDVEVPRASARADGTTVVTARPVATAATSGDEGGASSGSTQRVLGWTAGGLGLALLGAGVASGVMFTRTADEYGQQRCEEIDPNDGCASQYERMKTLNVVQWLGYAGGGALLATGVVLLLTAPRYTRRATALTCGAGPGTVGIACGGRF